MSEYRYGSASMGGAGGGGGGQQDNAAIMERVKAELAIAEAKEIVQVCYWSIYWINYRRCTKIKP